MIYLLIDWRPVSDDGSFDDIDNIYDYPKYIMLEKLIAIVDENINNCDYWKPPFTQTILVIITDDNENNYYHRLIFFCSH